MYLVYDKKTELGHVSLLLVDDESGEGAVVEYDSKEYSVVDLISNYMAGTQSKVGIVREIQLSNDKVERMYNNFYGLRARESSLMIDSEVAKYPYALVRLNMLGKDRIEELVDKVNYIEDTADAVIYDNSSRAGFGANYYGTTWKEYFLNSRNCVIFVNFLIDSDETYGYHYKKLYIPEILYETLKEKEG